MARPNLWLWGKEGEKDLQTYVAHAAGVTDETKGNIWELVDYKDLKN